jgi:chromosome segregation ATPase
MQPDHPLLQRAQQALSRQLEARRYALDGELREKQNALQVLLEPQHRLPALACHAHQPLTTLVCLMQKAKQSREAVGVELYGFQQALAKLQTTLESAQHNYQTINAAREKVRPTSWHAPHSSWR